MGVQLEAFDASVSVGSAKEDLSVSSLQSDACSVDSQTKELASATHKRQTPWVERALLHLVARRVPAQPLPREVQAHGDALNQIIPHPGRRRL